MRAAQARYDELVASLYPLFSATASHELSDQDRNNSGNRDRGSSNRARSRFVAGITVEQPIFSGFRDTLLTTSADQELSAIKFEDIRSRELIYSDVAQVFYQIQYYAQDLKQLAQTQNVLNERIKELDQFVALGKSKESEMLSAQSDLLDIQSQVAQSQGLLRAARELLGYMIGREAWQIKLNSQSKPFLKESLESYLSRVENRADLSASKSRRDSKQDLVKSSERERWGTVALSGSYDPVDAPSGDSNSSVKLNFDLPIFDFGRIDARTRQRQADFDAAQLKALQLQRLAERDVRIAWVNLTSTEAEIAQLQNLVEAASKAYQAQKSDYSLGIVNNLDVLQGIRNLQQAKRRLLKATYDLKTRQSELIVATGGL